MKHRGHIVRSLLLPVLSLLPALPLAVAGGPDIEREQRLADQTVDAILDGEPVFLTTSGNTRFLAIEMPAVDEPPRGAAIILHGRGTHPDWSQVAAPLRTALPEHGWSTLSLQMPVLAKDAKYYDYLPLFPAAVPRIEAGIRHLREQGAQRIVLIAHSCSVHMSMSWIETMGDSGIDAYIGIGMGAIQDRHMTDETGQGSAGSFLQFGADSPLGCFLFIFDEFHFDQFMGVERFHQRRA